MRVYKSRRLRYKSQRRQNPDHAGRPRRAQDHPRVPRSHTYPIAFRKRVGRCATKERAATGSFTPLAGRSAGRHGPLSKSNNEFTVNIALMENNVCMGRLFIAERCTLRAAVGFVPPRSIISRRTPPRSIPTTRSSAIGRRCRWPGRVRPSAWPFRVRTRRPRPVSMSPAAASGTPIWRSSSRAVPHKFCATAEKARVDYVALHTYGVGHGGGELILAEGRRQHPHASRRPGAALQRGGPPQSVVRLPVEVLEDIRWFCEPVSFCAGCVRNRRPRRLRRYLQQRLAGIGPANACLLSGSLL